MVASVIEELSLKDEHSKLLREKLAIIQEAQVSAVSAGFAATSNLQLLRCDALLGLALLTLSWDKNWDSHSLVNGYPSFYPRIALVAPSPEELRLPAPSPFFCADGTVWRRPCGGSRRSFKTVYVPSGKLAGWLARLWLSPRSIESPRPARKWRHPRRRLLDLQSLTAWGLRPPRLRGLWRRSRPFELAPAGPGSGKCARSLARLLRLPQPDNVDGSQVGARLADFAPHWRSLLGNCRATGIVEDGVGIAFLQRPQLTHQSISFRTRNSHQDLQQAVDALLMKGAIERVTNVTSLGFYSRLFLVPKKTGDLRPVINLSTLNRHMVVPYFKMETQGSVRSAIRSQEWTVSIDICDAYLHVPMHQAVCKYLRFVVNKKVYQFTCLPFGLATSPWWVHQTAETRRLAVKAARCEATRLLRRLADQGRYTGTGSTARPDNHQGAPVSWLDHQLREVRSHTKSRLPVHRDAVQHSTFHSGAVNPTEDASKGPVSSSALDDRSKHHGQRFAQTSRHVGVHGFAVLARTAPSSGPMVGRHSMVPEDRELVRPDSSSTVGSVRNGMVVISSSPARSTLVTKETEVTLFTDPSSWGWGAQLGSRSTQGQWSASQRSWHINVLEIQAVIYAVRPTDVIWGPGWFDWCATMQWLWLTSRTRGARGRTLWCSLPYDCSSGAITLVPVHLPGVHNIQADSLSRVGQTLTTEWTMAMESLRPVFAKWGEQRIYLFATFTNWRLIKFVSPYPEPRAEWTDAMFMPWDNGRGPLYAFPPFKMVPQVLQKIAQSPGVEVILIAQLQPAALWFPELMNLSQEDPIPLFVEGQDLLTQDVWTGDGVWPKLTSLPTVKSTRVETRSLGPIGWVYSANFHLIRNQPYNSHPILICEGSFQGSCQHDVKVPSGIFTASVQIPLVKIRGVL